MTTWGYCRFCKRDVELDRLGLMGLHYTHKADYEQFNGTSSKSRPCIGYGSKPTKAPAETEETPFEEEPCEVVDETGVEVAHQSANTQPVVITLNGVDVSDLVTDAVMHTVGPLDLPPASIAVYGDEESQVTDVRFGGDPLDPSVETMFRHIHGS